MLDRPETSSSGKVRVKALGLLGRRLPGGGPVEIPLPEGRALTVREAVRLAGLPDEEVFVVIVGGRRVPPNHVLAPGDEMVCVPPVAGG
ncbi:MAG: MoaD/ThiS family protein [Firmicutes bacterium]|nr:MoaD/ThiS family protein [Bacillota bacterium]